MVKLIILYTQNEIREERKCGKREREREGEVDSKIQIGSRQRKQGAKCINNLQLFSTSSPRNTRRILMSRFLCFVLLLHSSSSILLLQFFFFFWRNHFQVLLLPTSSYCLCLLPVFPLHDLSFFILG